MSNKITKIQVRRDTYANWTTNNPKVSDGEFAYSTPDTAYPEGTLKIGDGKRAWKDLAIIGTGGDADFLNVPTDIIPTVDAGVDGSTGMSLGSGDKRWKDLYLSSNSIYLGDGKLTIGSTGVGSGTGTGKQELQIEFFKSDGTPDGEPQKIALNADLENVNTTNLPLQDLTVPIGTVGSAYEYFSTVPETLPPATGLQTQADVNKWVVSSLVQLDEQGDGATGPVGPIGPTGATGPQGEPSAAFDIVGTVANGGDPNNNGLDIHGATCFECLSAADRGNAYLEDQGDGIWICDGSQYTKSIIKGPEGAQGDQGSTGIEGPQGPQGDQGSTGIEGPQGPTGADSTVEGPQGDQGSTGIEGAQGAQGDQGSTGIEGPQGAQGDQGSTGIEGPQGPTGADSTVEGPQGATGPQGDPGSPGPGIDIIGTVANGKDPNSDRDIHGDPCANCGVIADIGNAYLEDQGDGIWICDGKQYTKSLIQGPDGDQGPQGDQGSTGIEGPQGLQGDQGSTGIEGPQGLQGDQGDQGSTGIEGPQGSAGIEGPQGSTGIEGPQGAQGAQGDQGSTGIEGPQGPTGADSTVEGPQGAQGDQGSTGIEGPQGSAGIEGPQGSTGIEGPQGDQGSTGLSGSNSLTFRGSVDVTSDGSIPADPENGDFVLNTTTGTVHTSWGPPIADSEISANQLVLYAEGINVGGVTGATSAWVAGGVQDTSIYMPKDNWTTFSSLPS